MRSTGSPPISAACTRAFAKRGSVPLLAPEAADAGLVQWLRWRHNRLRCMQPAEIPHRLARLARALAERSRLLPAGAVPAPDRAPVSHPWVRAAPGIGAAAYVKAADRIASGVLEVFAARDLHYGGT